MKVLITGGGTGGHLYPALALAKGLLKRGHQVIYVGAKGRLEEGIVPPLIRDSFFLNLIPSNHSWGFLRSQWSAMGQAKEIIMAKKPDIIIGFGGFISLPCLSAGWLSHIPLFIHEQNVLPGKVNRLISPFVRGIAVSFKESIPYFSSKKVSFIGNPRASECQGYYAKPYHNTVLIVMGSQGSMTVNKVLLDYLRTEKKAYKIKVITGKKHYPMFSTIIKDHPEIEIVPFSTNLLEDIQKSKLVVSRAGATTLAELAALGTPGILIPSPFVSENHQMINAKVFEQRGAAKILTEESLTSERLNSEINLLLSSPAILSQMRTEMHRLAKLDALDDLIKFIRKAGNSYSK